MAMPSPGSPAVLRSRNARAVLDALAVGEPLSRADVMQRTGLSRTAVTQLLRALTRQGTVIPADADRTTGGPAAQRVALNPDLGVAVAAHLTADRVDIVLVDATGARRAHRNAPREPDVLTQVADLVADCNPLAMGYLHCAVLGVAGIVDPRGAVHDDSGHDGGALRDGMAATLGVPVRVENDVNLAALAEMDVAPDPEPTFAYVSFAHGLGAALVIDGALHRGSSGGAGEITYLLQPGVPLGTPALGRGVLAELAAAHGLDAELSPEYLLDAAGAGDEGAVAVTEIVADRIALIVGSLRLVLDPDAVVLAGLAAHPLIMSGVRRRLDLFADRLPVRTRAALGGRHATLHGACIEATATLRDELFPRIISALTESTRA